MGVRKYRNRWVADYRDQHRKRRVEAPRGPFENAAQERIAAQALLTKRLAEVAQGRHQPISARPTFSVVCNRFLESKVNIRPTTKRSYSTLIEMYLKPYFGTQKVQTISPEAIERFRFELTEGLPSPVADAFVARRLCANPSWSQARAKQLAARMKPGARTINKTLTLLTMILNYACRHRWCDYNAAEHVERLPATANVNATVDANILSPEEVRRLIDAMPESVYRLIVQTAIFTGMRQGEILGLQWGDIDWNSRQIHVRRAWKEGAFTEPKTRNSVRRVDLPEFLVLELKRWRLHCPKSGLDLVFPNGAGKPESHSNLLQRGFYPALRRVGLRKIRFHDLRHTYASLMLAKGEDIVRVSRMLGHASPTITLNVYAHLLPREHYGSADRLAQLVYGERGAPAPASPVEPTVVPFPAATDRRP